MKIHGKIKSVVVLIEDSDVSQTKNLIRVHVY